MTTTRARTNRRATVATWASIFAALRRARQRHGARGLAIKQAAAFIGVPVSTYYSWESGQARPDALTLARLCDLYGISLDGLVRGVVCRVEPCDEAEEGLERGPVENLSQGLDLPDDPGYCPAHDNTHEG